jgi:hypothetical protein
MLSSGLKRGEGKRLQFVEEYHDIFQKVKFGKIFRAIAGMISDHSTWSSQWKNARSQKGISRF